LPKIDAANKIVTTTKSFENSKKSRALRVGFHFAADDRINERLHSWKGDGSGKQKLATAF
jgi:hypothetical protein